MSLPKMIFENLEPNDRFGLKILKNGFKDHTHLSHIGQKQTDYEFKQEYNHYLQDVVVLEQKRMNTMMKEMYLEDFMEDL